MIKWLTNLFRRLFRRKEKPKIAPCIIKKPEGIRGQFIGQSKGSSAHKGKDRKIFNQKGAFGSERRHRCQTS